MLFFFERRTPHNDLALSVDIVGGVLGCYCQHWYPHTANSPKHAPIFPSVLKGSDLYLYCVFVALGLEVTIHPVLARDYDEVEERVYDDHDEVYVGDHPCGTGAAETDMGGYDDQAIEEVYAEFGQRETIQWLNAPDASTRQVGFYHLAVSAVVLTTCLS
jgi:hypothetical protein